MKSQNILIQFKKVQAGLNTYGNTPGNIINNGLAAQQGNWIYYENRSDNNFHKIRTDGTDKKIVK